MPYSINLTNRAKKDIRRLDARIAVQVQSAIDGLADEPRPMGYIKLATTEDYRITVAKDYRIIYTVNDTARVVTILEVGNRNKVYQKYKRR